MKPLIRNIPITVIGIPGLWLFATAAGRPTLDKEKSQIEFVGSKAAPCKIAMTDTILAVSAKFTIDRTKWGMTYGKGRVNDEVDISVALVFAC